MREGASANPLIVDARDVTPNRLKAYFLGFVRNDLMLFEHNAGLYCVCPRSLELAWEYPVELDLMTHEVSVSPDGSLVTVFSGGENLTILDAITGRVAVRRQVDIEWGWCAEPSIPNAITYVWFKSERFGSGRGQQYVLRYEMHTDTLEEVAAVEQDGYIERLIAVGDGSVAFICAGNNSAVADRADPLANWRISRSESLRKRFAGALTSVHAVSATGQRVALCFESQEPQWVPAEIVQVDVESASFSDLHQSTSNYIGFTYLIDGGCSIADSHGIQFFSVDRNLGNTISWSDVGVGIPSEAHIARSGEQILLTGPSNRMLIVRLTEGKDLR